MAGAAETRLLEMAAGLPARVGAWRKGEPELYGPEDLFRYIDGGAELYISYGFASLLSQPYVDADGDEIRLDVFDMGTPGDAFGVFRLGSEAVDRFVGDDVESEYAGGLLQFWKGRYYASLLAYPETAARKQLLETLARSVAGRVEGGSEPPALVALLPAADRVPRSVRYFRHHAWLNDYHDFGEENLLRLDGEAEAAMARYRPAGEEGGGAVLVAVRYPDAAAAAAAERSVARALLPGAADGMRGGADGRWSGCRREGELLAVVAGAPDREAAERLLRACAEAARRD